MNFKWECSINQICNILFIPYSTVSRVIREYNHNPKVSSNWFETTMKKANDSVIIKQAIKNYVHKTNNVLIANDIFSYIQQTFSVTLQKRIIIKILKEEANMSYWNASSRLKMASTLSNQILKLLFCIEFSITSILQMLLLIILMKWFSQDEQKLIINKRMALKQKWN